MLQPVVLGLYYISLTGVVVGLNTGVTADSPAEANIAVEQHVAEIDVSGTDAEPPFENSQLAQVTTDIESVSVLPEPYHSRFDRWMHDRTTSALKVGVRYGLTIADYVAAAAYANQAMLTASGVMPAIKGLLKLSVLAPAGWMIWKRIGWYRRLNAR